MHFLLDSQPLHYEQLLQDSILPQELRFLGMRLSGWEAFLGIFITQEEV